MKKQCIVVSIVVCVIIIFSYLQYGREEKVVSSRVNTSDSYYEQEFSVVANKLFIWDKEKYAKKLINKSLENEYKNVRFSYDFMGYPNEINVTVYYNVWSYQHGKSMFQVVALKENRSGSITFKIRVTKN